MLNAEIALTYDRADLQYLSGLKAHQKEHRALLQVWSDAQFEGCPIVPGPHPQYWGRGCQVTFTHAGQTVTHRGLVVLAGPLRDQLRQTRQRQLQDLTVIETRFIDGSCMRRLTPLAPEFLAILPLVLAALESLIEHATPAQPSAALPGSSPPLLLPKLN